MDSQLSLDTHVVATTTVNSSSPSFSALTLLVWSFDP